MVHLVMSRSATQQLQDFVGGGTLGGAKSISYLYLQWVTRSEVS